jgi:arylsulfatase
MPVTTDYAGDTSKFNGKIDLVQIDLGDDNHDHLIDPDEIIRIAFARQ